MNLESANLVLRTSSISEPDKNSNRTEFIWKNINLRVALGSMYDKYSKFKICPTSIGNANTSTISVSDRVLVVHIGGLMWENQSYNTTVKTNGYYVSMATVAFNSGFGFSNNFTGEIGYVFNKPQSDSVNIEIYYSMVSDGQLPNNNYGESVFCFSIYGIE